MPLTRKHSLPAAALLALLAAGPLACQPSTHTPDVGEPAPDAGGQLPPDAGAPDAGPQPVVDPSWDGVSVRQRWLREGLGEPAVVRAVDVDGDGQHELAFGGRGIALVDEATRVTGAPPRWSLDWVHDEQPSSGGERSMVWGMERSDVNGDGVPDLIAVTDRSDAYAVDGVTGARLWHAQMQGQFFPARMTTFDADGDGTLDFFPSGGTHAYSGRTGERLWEGTDLTGPAVFVEPMAGGSALAITTEEDLCTECSPDPTFVNVFAYDGSGRLLFSAAAPNSPSALAVANLDTPDAVPADPALPAEEVILGTWEGWVAAVGHTGLRWKLDIAPGVTEWWLRPMITAIATHDVDGDGRSEIFVATSLTREVPAGMPRDLYPANVHQLSPDGQVQWSYTVGPRVNDLRFFTRTGEGSTPQLVAAAGEHFTVSRGSVLALDVSPDASERLLWRKDYPTAMLNLEEAHARVPGTADMLEPLIVLGGRDSNVHALRPGDGAPVWKYGGGNWVLATATGDADGDGLEDVVSGDDRGELILTDGVSGHRRWTRRMDLRYAGTIYGVAVGDLTADGKAEVVSVAEDMGPVTDPGLLQVFAADGTVLLTHRFEGAIPVQVEVADLEGDGVSELVLAEATSIGCGVRVMSIEGVTRWSNLTSEGCVWPHLTVGNLDEDPALEVAYAEQTFGNLPTTSLLDSDGTLLWKRTPPMETAFNAYFVTAVPGGLLYGGEGMDGGFVIKQSALDGTEVWRTGFADHVDPEAPALLLYGVPTYGALVDDRDGDGVAELAVSTAAGDVHLLDGATGTVRWVRNVAPRDVPSVNRHTGGPLAWVPATASQPPYLLATQAAGDMLRSTAFVLRADGERVSTFALEGSATSVAVGRFTAGAQPGVAVGAGLSVYTYEAVKAP